MIVTNNIIQNFQDKDNKLIKDYFTLDIDNLDWLHILYIYAKIYANFTETITDVKNDLEYNRIIRLYYSSSKTGVHFKVNVKNNFIENIYYRTLLNDDIMRIKQDILRANYKGVNFTYDIAFKYKHNKLLNQKKEFNIINYKLILDNCLMTKRTFYKLIKYIKLNNQVKISLLLSCHKSKLKHIENNLSISPLGIENIKLMNNPNLNEIEFSDDTINKFKSILNKYANKNTKSLTRNYTTDLSLELCKSIYRLAKEE